MSWYRLRTSFTNFRKGTWGTFVSASIAAGVFLYFVGTISWASIAAAILGLFLARELACDILRRWVKENISPGTEGGLSLMYPRVWTLELVIINTCIQEIVSKISGESEDHPVGHIRDNGDTCAKVVIAIDEYVNRVRVHRWRGSVLNVSCYDWFDLDKSTGTHWNFDKHRGCHIWDYSTEALVDRELILSCSWERDILTKEPYFQLVLWVRNWEEPTDAPPRDVYFKIPLEPRRLSDERGQLVYVQGQGGQQFKAGDLEVYPYDEDGWKSDEDKETRWRWCLKMKTFHEYIAGSV